MHQAIGSCFSSVFMSIDFEVFDVLIFWVIFEVQHS